MNDPRVALVPSDALHADAVLAGSVPLRGEYDPAEVARQGREVMAVLGNIAAEFAQAAGMIVATVRETFVPAMLEAYSTLTLSPHWHEFARKMRTLGYDFDRDLRHDAFLARWRALTPRQRKDLLRRRRKGMRLC